MSRASKTTVATSVKGNFLSAKILVSALAPKP